MKETSLRETDGFMRKGFPVLHKKGIVSPYGEMTPFVFNGKLYRVESVDEYHCAKPEAIKSSYAVIRDVKTGKIVSKLGKGNYFFDAFVDNKKVYVFGTLNNSIYGWYGGDTVNVFESEDLIVWKERPLFQKKDWLFFNHSITKCDEGYLLTVEVAKPAEVVGDHPFTFIFAKSKNLIDWQILDYEKTAYPIDRYCGGASIRYFNGYYYFFGLVEIPGPIYVMYLTRTQDFEKWEIGKYNPFVAVIFTTSEERPLVMRTGLKQNSNTVKNSLKAEY